MTQQVPSKGALNIDHVAHFVPDVDAASAALTRLGFNSKMVITGDLTQVDLPNSRKSGLLDAVDVLSDVEGITFIRFDEKDVVRHSLVQQIVRAYDRYDELVGKDRQLSFRLGADGVAREPQQGREAQPAPAPAANPQSVINLDV